MLCVPRSCAASPCVMERMTQILSAICAVSLRCSENTSPVEVGVHGSQRPAIFDRSSGLGSNDSWCAIPPGRKMWITDLAGPSFADACAGNRDFGIRRRGFGFQEVSQRKAQAPDEANIEKVAPRPARTDMISPPHQSNGLLLPMIDSPSKSPLIAFQIAVRASGVLRHHTCSSQ